MERLERIVQYLCFVCGAQGTQRVREPDALEIAPGKTSLLSCPWCGRKVTAVASLQEERPSSPVTL